VTASTRIIDRFGVLYPDDVAGILEPFEPDQSAPILASLAPTTASRVIARLTPHAAAETLERLEPLQAARIVECLEPNRAAALLARMRKDSTAEILKRTSGVAKRDLERLMAYAPDSAGGLMDPRVTTFSPETTVEQAIARLRGTLPRRISDVFLVNREGQLSGVVRLQDIATAPAGTRLDQIAHRSTALVGETATREDVAEIVQEHDAMSLPVVDFDNRLVGVIRHDSLVDTIEHEASADIQTMVGVSKDERALSNVWFVVGKRLPWLQVNLATAFLAAAVVGLFEETIARLTALAVLLPVVAGQSGNTGAQALAVIMRGLSLREITPRQSTRVLAKELSVAIVNGVAVALVTGAGVLVWSGSLGLAGVTAVAMVISMGCAGLAGAAIPLVLSRIGQDPAQSSSIILTTVTDVTGFFSFLGLATLFSSLLS